MATLRADNTPEHRVFGSYLLLAGMISFFGNSRNTEVGYNAGL